jgi:hypothetical protein
MSEPGGSGRGRKVMPSKLALFVEHKDVHSPFRRVRRCSGGEVESNKGILFFRGRALCARAAV